MNRETVILISIGSCAFLTGSLIYSIPPPQKPKKLKVNDKLSFLPGDTKRGTFVVTTFLNYNCLSCIDKQSEIQKFSESNKNRISLVIRNHSITYFPLDSQTSYTSALARSRGKFQNFNTLMLQNKRDLKTITHDLHLDAPLSKKEIEEIKSIGQRESKDNQIFQVDQVPFYVVSTPKNEHYRVYSIDQVKELL